MIQIISIKLEQRLKTEIKAILPHIMQNETVLLEPLTELMKVKVENSLAKMYRSI